MTAREYCKSHPVTAYDSSYGRCGGFQIHGDVQYGIDDYIYAQSGVLCDDEKYFHYHHLKIIYGFYRECRSETGHRKRIEEATGFPKKYR